MDHWSSYPSHLAQIPTDQRELEQHRLLVQTGAADSNAFFNTSQTYHPCPPEGTWAAARSTLAPGSLITLPPGYTSDPWGAYVLGPFEHSSLAPESTVDPYFSEAPSNGAALTTPSSTMDHPFPKNPKHYGPDDLLDWNTEPAPSPWLIHGQAYHPAKVEGSQSSIHTMHEASPSPPVSISSQHSPTCSMSSASPSVRAVVPDSTSPRTSIGDHSEEEQVSELPYSHLIYQALLTGEGQQMPLQEIYAWFEKNTNKGKDQSCKGWQNSIRHNLSMNAGFEAIKVDVPGGKRPLSVWRLTEEARRNGKVESTTRYRKPGNRRSMNSDPPAPSRQGPGSRGGKASKHAAKRNQPNPEEQRQETYFTQAMLHQQNQLPQPQPPMDNSNSCPTLPSRLPYRMPHMVTSLTQAHRDNYVQAWDYNSVTGCTNPPPGGNPVFCDSAESAFDMGSGWYGLAPNHGSITIPEGPL